MNATAFWVVMLGMAVGAFGFRASFLLLGDRMTLPSWLQRALDFVPPAVLAALVVPVFADMHRAWDTLATARLIAGIVASLVAYRTRSVLLTLLTGMGVLWLALWLFGAA